MKSYEYILGYMLSLIPMILIQNVLLFGLALLLGLEFSINIILTIFASIVVSILFISIGILFGSLFSEKASSGISSIIVQFVCFTSGMYFSIDLVGKGFTTVCHILPFEGSLNILKAVLNNDFSMVTTTNIVVFILYTLAILILSIIIFNKKMTSDNR
jgi:ABC-2 type transport system permease protein